MEYYTGIGSRSTPADILATMTKIATALDKRGMILRSGGAEGADSAFEAGIVSTHKEIYLPWPEFNSNQSILTGPSANAMKMAADFHPSWHQCSQGARKMHGRNCHQILGADLETPSLFVVCWTPEGKMVGGTAQALRIAEKYGIHVFNLGHEGDLDLLREWFRGP